MWNLITDEDIKSLSVPDRLFAYADAYLEAASATCASMAKDPALEKWANAAVILMITAHAVELFIKGAILARSPTANVWQHGHDLDDLASDYRSHFPEPSFSWDIPFQTDFPTGLSSEEMKAIKKEMPPPSILYRYPVQKGGDDWQGLFGFEAESFLLLLSDISRDFHRIKTQLEICSQEL